MASNFSWSMNLGRWVGIPVRIHLLLFLFVAIIFGSTNPNDTYFSTAVVTTLVLIGSILVHEFAHVFALHNLGGHVDTMVLLPWGGNSRFIMPESSHAKTLVYLAGPFANGAVFLLCTTLLVQSNGAMFTQLINPFHPHGFGSSGSSGGFVVFIKIVTWVNFQLLIVNLIPCFPFDGAGVVRAWIASLNANLPKYRVESAIKLIGDASAFAFVGLAWFLKEYQAGPVDPMWLLFLMASITLLFASKFSMNQEMLNHELQNHELQNHEFVWDDVEDMDYSSPYGESSFLDFTDTNENSAYSQWLQEKQEARRDVELRDEQMQAEDEDQRADEILEKLHLGGISAITDDERTILDRVSARIRRRRQQGV